MKKNVKELFYNILTSNYGTVGYANVRRLVLLNSFLLIGIFAFTTLGTYSMLVAKNYLISCVDYCGLLCFALCFWYLRTHKNEKLVIKISSATMMILMLIFITINGNDNFGLIWSFFTPMFLISLNGYKKGLNLSLLFYAAVYLSLLINHNSWSQNGWNELVLVRFFVSSFMVIFVMYMSEYAITKLQKELQLLSSTDSLTNLYNRGKIEEAAKTEFEKKRKTDNPLSLVMMDVDDFKAVNDTHGHHIGDDILKEISTLLSNNIRSIDSLGRWGGEEFLMIFPETTLENALTMVKRLQEKVNSHTFTMDKKITCSFGICSIIKNKFEDKEAIIAADNVLYQAKNSGKNRICTTTLS